MRVTILSVLCLAFVLSCGATPEMGPSQDQAQAELDAAFLEADRIEIYRVVGEGTASSPLLIIDRREEIRDLVRFFRLQIVERFEEIDGRKQKVRQSIGCGCYGQFVMVVSRSGDRLLNVRLAHGKLIACPEIDSVSMIEVDEAQHRPFFDRLINLLPPEDTQRKIWEKQRANQALQTTPMTRSVYEKTTEFRYPQRGV